MPPCSWVNAMSFEPERTRRSLIDVDDRRLYFFGRVISNCRTLGTG